MALKPGTVGGFSESMAQAMEDALRHHWPVSERPIPFEDSFLRLLFVAIAQGVVRHLEENPAAFKVRVEVPEGDDRADGEVSRVETTGVSPAASE